MAIISPYIATKTYVGQDIGVKVKKIIWLKVGEGKVKIYSDYEVNIAGKINVMGYNGPLNIHLKLMDRDPSAMRGPCCLQLNKHMDEKAKYMSTNKALTVYAVLGGKKQNITIRPVEKGTQTECQLFGHVDETVHLDPV